MVKLCAKFFFTFCVWLQTHKANLNCSPSMCYNTHRMELTKRPNRNSQLFGRFLLWRCIHHWGLQQPGICFMTNLKHQKSSLRTSSRIVGYMLTALAHRLWVTICLTQGLPRVTSHIPTLQVNQLSTFCKYNRSINDHIIDLFLLTCHHRLQ